jgi:hypothetical protein
MEEVREELREEIFESFLSIIFALGIAVITPAMIFAPIIIEILR